MNALSEVVDYITKKIEKTNVNNPKANSGAALLKLHLDWKEDILDFVGIAFQVMQFQFTRTSSESPAGVSQLTSTSTMIGLKISERISRDPLPWTMQIRLGDLFIEAFKICEYVDLYYPKIRNSSYVLSATCKWIELADIPDILEKISIIGTVYEKPEPITTPGRVVLGRSLPVIKENTESFDITQPWVASMNKLQSIAWTINKKVLDAMMKNSHLFTSDEPIEDNDAKELKRRSKQVEWSFITKKAEWVLNKEKPFYQYLEADYRGRLYYTEPFLNFQGSDMARGILQFARGKPMTEEGLQWLAIHTASSFNMSYDIKEIPEWCSADYKSYLASEGLDNISVDKMTLEDRIQWTNMYMDEIIEAGQNGTFTDKAEKPVSFLAACVEWYNYNVAYRENRIHMSHLPIPIDGSNNGWQHLGAISKDSHTGELVGLVPIEIQKDFYVQTAKELINLTKDERLSNILSSMFMKEIRKGISKRGSMTRAYSAGATKIAENMFFDCKAEDYHIKYDITEKDCIAFAKILVKAIDNVCPGPLQTMTYLQNLAAYQIGKYKRFDKDGNEATKEHSELRKRKLEIEVLPTKTDKDLEALNEIVNELQTYENKLIYGNGEDFLTWTTPSGFKVVYKNWIMKDYKARGTIDGKQIKHVARIASEMPDIRGFMCGVSPNYIHSMDASHMALVISNWKGDFGAVHDSFSAHACDIEDLLALTKKTFIDMYDHENFFSTIRTDLTNNTDDVEQPALGSLNIKEIEDSDYFFA